MKNAENQVIDRLMASDEAAVAEVTEAPAPAAKKKSAKKGKAKPKGKAKGKAKGKGGSTVSRPRLLYRLAAGVKLDEYDPQTHAGAVVHALRKLGEGTKAQVVEQVNKDKKIKTGMDITDAVSFMLWQLRKDGVVVGKPAPKAA